MSKERIISRSRTVMILCLLIMLLGCSSGGRSRARLGAPTNSSTTPAYWPTREWRTSTPEEQGMDSQQLAHMLEAVEAQGLDLHSLLIIRHGYIVSETYFSPHDQNTRHELYSCTKSFISTLVGIAVDQGALDRIDRRALDVYSGYTFANPDARKEAMTVEHLLTMTSGLGWQEGDPIYRAMYMSNDWIQYVLDTPMSEQPGERFNYCSGCSHVLAGIVQGSTGSKVQDFARKNLFQPLGISNWKWDTDAKGMAIGGWGLQLTARDMAKLGYLYLRQGTWDGKQIVSPAWVEEATRQHTTTDGSLGYGYQWWIYPTLDAYTALGRYGQTIFVIPKLDLIVVTTANMEGHDPIFELIERYVVPATGG
jgi:CubicO group peptidase (beta-lactamase class C family)